MSLGAGVADGVAFRQIPLAWAERQAAPAVAAGLSIEDLYSRALIAPKFGDERDQISPLQLLVFYAALVLETDDGTHSMMRHRHAPSIGPLGFRILLGSPNLNDGILALAKFYDLASRSIRLQLSTEGDQAFLAIQAEDDLGGGLFEEDIQLVYLYFGLTRFLGRNFPASWVGTRDIDHLSLGSTHHLIGRPVRLHRSAGLAFPRALLAARPPSSGLDDFTWRPIGDALSLMAKEHRSAPDGVNHHDLRLARAAADQGMAPSTYRRMMAQTGSGFRQLRERALLDVTLDHLRTRTCSVDAIAADLGYSEARSLRRFVKRATGRTPAELRRDLPGGVPPAKLRTRLQEILELMPA